MLRPRFVWGPDDTTLLPAISEMIEKGRFAWIGGGRHRTSTTHVDNVVEGLMLAAERGRAGEAYFVTDGEPVVFRDFLTRLLATRGVDPGDRNLPAGVAKPVAATVESAWRVLRLKGEAPLTRFAVWNSTLECTIDDSKARRELGYAPVISVEDGLAGMASSRLSARRCAADRSSPYLGEVKVHTLKREQLLPRPVDQVFPFFADAHNLERITPRCCASRCSPRDRSSCAPAP